MNHEDRKILKEQGEKLDKLLIIVAGDEKLQIKGLVHRQYDDEEWQKGIKMEIREMKANQEKMHAAINAQSKDIKHQSEELKEHDDRLNIVETFYHIVDKLSNIKKKTVAAFIAIAAFITGLLTFWEKITHFFNVK